jgi:hypothetical protein
MKPRQVLGILQVIIEYPLRVSIIDRYERGVACIIWRIWCASLRAKPRPYLPVALEFLSQRETEYLPRVLTAGSIDTVPILKLAPKQRV